jgi:hypothetical protein
MYGNLIDLTLHLHHETEKAILVSDDGDSDNAVWLPKSMCEIEVLKSNTIEVTLPETMAMEKGLI